MSTILIVTTSSRGATGIQWVEAPGAATHLQYLAQPPQPGTIQSKVPTGSRLRNSAKYELSAGLSEDYPSTRFLPLLSTPARIPSITPQDQSCAFHWDIKEQNNLYLMSTVIFYPTSLLLFVNTSPRTCPCSPSPVLLFPFSCKQLQLGFRSHHFTKPASVKATNDLHITHSYS